MKSSETKFWVKKAQRHDKDAFTELMQLYMKDMYRTAIAILMNEEDAAYASVDERYRLPMELYYSQGFKTKEIAKILSVPPNTVTRLSRGRKQLEEYYCD